MKNYYQILNIKPTATDDEIKRSYRVLAKKYHPDVNPGDAKAADRFADINEAHDVLSDPKKRAEYDAKFKESAAPRLKPEDIIARQRAQAQAAARQAAMRNVFATRGAAAAAGRSPYVAQAAAAQAAAQAEAQARASSMMQAQMTAIKNQAYKQGYDKAKAEAKLAAEREAARRNQTERQLNNEIKKLNGKLAEIELDRSDLEQELFNRDRELTMEKARADDLEQKLESAEKKAEEAKVAKAKTEEIAKLKEKLEKSDSRIRLLEAEKREAGLKNQAQIQLQQEKRKAMQTEIDTLRHHVTELETELESLRSENEQWQQYARSEDFISDAEERLQEWDKKVKADKKLAKGTLYGPLGVLIWATPEEIDEAYAKLVKRYSGKSDDSSVAKLAKVKEAYAVLSDPDKRKEYNESINVSEWQIEEEREAIADNERIKEEYRNQLESREFWARFDDLTFSAQTGDSDSQNQLGEMYYYGDEIEQDLSQAVYWFKEAAKQKHADAMYNLGICFLNGDGVDKNKATGLGFIRQAAKLGSKPAKDYVASAEKKRQPKSEKEKTA